MVAPVAREPFRRPRNLRRPKITLGEGFQVPATGSNAMLAPLKCNKLCENMPEHGGLAPVCITYDLFYL